VKSEAVERAPAMHLRLFHYLYGEKKKEGGERLLLLGK
jgi:hypothetical protein